MPKVKVNKARTVFKYRIYFRDSTRKLMEENIRACAAAYNACLDWARPYFGPEEIKGVRYKPPLIFRNGKMQEQTFNDVWQEIKEGTYHPRTGFVTEYTVRYRCLFTQEMATSIFAQTVGELEKRVRNAWSRYWKIDRPKWWARKEQWKQDSKAGLTKKKCPEDPMPKYCSARDFSTFYYPTISKGLSGQVGNAANLLLGGSKMIAQGQVKKANVIISLPRGNRFPSLQDITVRMHRPLEGRPTQLAITRDKAGDYFLIVVCEVLNPVKPVTDIQTITGIDLGRNIYIALTDYVNAYDSKQRSFNLVRDIPMPFFIEPLIKKERHAQFRHTKALLAASLFLSQAKETPQTEKDLSSLLFEEDKDLLDEAKGRLGVITKGVVRLLQNKKAKSNSEEEKVQIDYHLECIRKRREALARIGVKWTNCRHHWCHTFAMALAREKDLVFIEDLALLKLLEKNEKDPLFQQKIRAGNARSRAAWGTLILTIKTTMKRMGKYVVSINPAWTSHECSQCHQRNKNPLDVYSVFVCENPQCRFTANRDRNAAEVIRYRGMQQIQQAVASSLTPISIVEAIKLLGEIPEEDQPLSSPSEDVNIPLDEEVVESFTPLPVPEESLQMEIQF